MRRLALLAVLAAALLLPRVASAQSSAADSASLRPGDFIRLVVWRQPDFSGEFPVGPDGAIQHPLLRDVVVTGAPRSVIRDRIRTSLQRFDRDPQFVFDFLYRVAVGGEVRLPNLYNLSPETTIGQAVAAAGGATEFGSVGSVRLVRGGVRTTIDLRRPDPAVAEMRIRSGDQITIPRRTNILREYIGPLASVVAAAAALISVVDNSGN
ncbi:MAG TPA: polysaccharide biosynthesis/export family protein [Longimicrobium sp.]|nr:polysaccharide biosynthesis/export family protein [Longimicrobium sp.]